MKREFCCETCRRYKKRTDGYYCTIDGEKLGSSMECLRNKGCTYFHSNKNEPTLMNMFGW